MLNMKKKININSGLKGIFIGSCLVLVFQMASGQDIKKDVTVVKPYQPTVAEANKISQLPAFNDTLSMVPKFDYSISTIRLNTAFQPRTISAAKMAPEPLKFLYNNYIKLGLGNRLATLAEISIASNRSKKYSYGFYFDHKSASGKVKLENDVRVDAPFADNLLTLYGRRIFKKSVLSGNVGYLGNKIAFYGYHPSLKDTSLNKNDIIQYYKGGNINISLESLETDSAHLYYNFSGGYKYTSDNYKNAENQISIFGHMGEQYNDYYLGAELHFDNFKPGANNDTVHNTVISVRPYLSKSKGDWRFHIGLDATTDATESGKKFHPYLIANLEFAIVRSVLNAYVGYDGHLKKNNLSAIAAINPFFIPGLRLKNTNHPAHIFGGLKGNASADIYYSAQVSYSKINDQYFFINDSGILSNQFNVVYDDIELLQFSAEIDIKASEKLSVLARGNYRTYTMNHELYPWQMPDLDATLTFKYNMQNKIVLNADIFTIGRRYAFDPKTRKPVSMDSFFDFNLGIEYHYTKILSFFLQFKNLTANRYQIWNQYPAYRFQAMAGLTYAL
jgi:hypothetical protein